MPVTNLPAPSWLDACRRELGALIDERPDVRRLHAVDAWPLAVKRMQAGVGGRVPRAVARPLFTDDVVKIMAWASTRGVAGGPWGAGASGTGAPLARNHAPGLDLGRVARHR